MATEKYLLTEGVDSEPDHHSFEIQIPEPILADLGHGIDRVAKLIESWRPEMIFILLKSSAIPYKALREGLKKRHGIIISENQRFEEDDSQIPVAMVQVGREFDARVVEHKIDKAAKERAIDRDDEDLQDEFHLYYTLTQTDLTDYLVHDCDAASATTLADIKKVYEVKGRGTKVLVIDDTKNSGMTLDTIVPVVFKKSLGDSIEINELILIKNERWQWDIAEANFPDHDDATHDFIVKLGSGMISKSEIAVAVAQGDPEMTSKMREWLQIHQTDEDLVTITDQLDLQILGERVQLRWGANPLAHLYEELGIDFLLSYPQKLSEALIR